MKQYKDETYKGYKIEFEKRNTGRYGVRARAPQLTSQVLGTGATKQEAFDSLKSSMDTIDAAGNLPKRGVR